MSSRLLCRIVFGSYFAVFALALVLHATGCFAKKQMGRGLLWMLPAGLCTGAAIWAYSRLEDCGYPAGLIGLLLLLGLLLQTGGQLRASLKKNDQPKP